MITVLIVDDQTMFRDGLAKLITESTGMTVIGKVSNGQEAVEYYEDNDNIDVVVMDYRMPILNGLEATRKILEYDPEANIAMLSMYDDKELVLAAFLSGAKAFISKNDDVEELTSIIYTVSQGKHYLRDGQAGILIEALQRAHYPSHFPKSEEKPSPDVLTEMEIKILEQMAQEYTSSEIAENLGISVRTVEAHRRNMMTKTKTRNVVGLIMYALEKGYINVFSFQRNEKSSD